MGSKKRLLIITDTPTLSTGLSRICREVSTRMSQEYEVAVAGWHHMPLRTGFDFHIYPLRKGSGDEHNQMQVILQDFLPDFILCIGDVWDFSYLTHIVPQYIDCVKPCKTILWVTVDGEWLEPAYAEILRQFSNVASFSHYGVSVMKQFQPNREFSVIYPGIDHKTFYPYPDDYKWGEENIVDVDNTFMALVVGQNCDRKNMPATLESFAEFCRDKSDTLLFMVTNPKESYGFDLWQIIKKLKLGPKCVIAKNVNPRGGITDDKLNLLMNMSQIIVNTAIGEGLGMPLMEAQAAGCVPVVTNYAAGQEIVGARGRVIDVASMIYGQYGIKRAIVSHDNLVQHFNDLYNDWKNGKTLLSQYRQEGVDFMKDFTWDRTANELRDLINQTELPKEHKWVKEKVQVKEMDLLMVVPSWGKKCGIAEYSKELIEEMERQGKKVTVYPSNDLVALVSFVEENNFNIVCFQHEYSFFQDRFMLERCFDKLREVGSKTIVDLHSYSPVEAYNEILLEKADEIIVHCNAFKDALTKKRSISNVNVVNLGCKESVDFKIDDINKLKNNLGLDNGYPVIGSFGFIRDQKGYREIAEAIKELSEEYPNIKLLLVAPEHEFGSSSYEETFYSYIEDLGISDRVVLTREYMEEGKLLLTLSCVDIFVLNYKPSKAGGGNSAAIKTLMRAQRPIIVSDTFYFADMGNEVSKIGNMSSLAVKEAIRKQLKAPEEIRNQYVERMNAYLLKNSWENVAKDHLNIYVG